MLKCACDTCCFMLYPAKLLSVLSWTLLVAENSIPLISNIVTLSNFYIWSWFCLEELYKMCFMSHLCVKNKLMFIWVPNRICHLELIIVLWLGQGFEWKLVKLIGPNCRAFKSLCHCFIACAAAVFFYSSSQAISLSCHPS